ncbi:PHP domain-containing protein [Flintibacter muris]|uniref:PHP domain-containing protein n=1 Tax=Flintibacter muris TaxID=2941327 RepID=UPI002040432F|nr:PHP domain-containing protein [Flintibacter muris]
MIDIEILKQLNAPTREERLANLKTVLAGTKFPPTVPQYINNHIHTTYSFSPYSPTAAVYAARMEGLCTAGIVDHDSIAGAEEFLAAAELAGMPATVGMECRVSLKGTRLEGRRTNNPDQAGISYMTIQSVPHDKFPVLDRFFALYREARHVRNRNMTANINALLPGIGLDYDRDVLPLSLAREGGGTTERHLMYALAQKLVEQTGKGSAMAQRLSGLGITLSDKQRAQLEDTEYPFYEYDLLGILKGAFVGRVYVDADEECPPLSRVVELCRETDACLCYPYLGDVVDSVTGDKKAQKFEDSYLEDVFLCMKEEGVWAVTYMPTRNTSAQLERLRKLCEKYGMFQVSGEDINSPRQSFITQIMEDPRFQNLIDATWKLIEHEKTGAALR